MENKAGLVDEDLIADATSEASRDLVLAGVALTGVILDVDHETVLAREASHTFLALEAIKVKIRCY